MELIGQKADIAAYVSFLQATTQPNIHFKEHQEFFDETGKELTHFAAKVVRTEMKRYKRQINNFVIEHWGLNLHNVQNKAYGTTYQVILGRESSC